MLEDIALMALPRGASPGAGCDKNSTGYVTPFNTQDIQFLLNMEKYWKWLKLCLMLFPTDSVYVHILWNISAIYISLSWNNLCNKDFILCPSIVL